MGEEGPAGPRAKGFSHAQGRAGLQLPGRGAPGGLREARSCRCPGLCGSEVGPWLL
jgi:hypothetical protein